MSPHTTHDADNTRKAELRQLLALIDQSGKAILADWDNKSLSSLPSQEKTSISKPDTFSNLVDKEMFRNVQTLLGSAGMLAELVQEPGERLLELGGEVRIVDRQICCLFHCI